MFILTDFLLNLVQVMTTFCGLQCFKIIWIMHFFFAAIY